MAYPTVTVELFLDKFVNDSDPFERRIQPIMTRPFSDSPSAELVEILVHDVPEPCPYLPGVTARMPLRLQFERDPERLDLLLAEGDRRVGPLMYRTQCASCKACESLRIPLEEFSMSRSQRRVWNKNQDLTLRISAPPSTDRERVALFNRHRLERGCLLYTSPSPRD